MLIQKIGPDNVVVRLYQWWL